MAHVDALSRNPSREEDSTVYCDGFPNVMSINQLDWLHTLQLEDSELCRIRDILSSDLDAYGLANIRENYLIKDHKLYKCVDGDKSNLRWVVPKGARWQFCLMKHDEIGHFWWKRLLNVSGNPTDSPECPSLSRNMFKFVSSVPMPKG